MSIFFDQVSTSIRKLLDPNPGQPNRGEYYKALGPTSTTLYSLQFIL